MAEIKVYMVWRDGGDMPKVTHDTLESAQAEAHRLSEKHPGVEFHIIASVDVVKAATRKATMKDCRTCTAPPKCNAIGGACNIHILPMDGEAEGIDRLELMARAEHMKKGMDAAEKSDAPVIEVGDVVKWFDDSFEVTVAGINNTEEKACLIYDDNSFTVRPLSDLTLIRKGPKVHRFEGVEWHKEWHQAIPFSNPDTNMGVELDAMCSNGKHYTLTLTEEEK